VNAPGIHEERLSRTAPSAFLSGFSPLRT
jgi:hypothetical protein